MEDDDGDDEALEDEDDGEETAREQDEDEAGTERQAEEEEDKERLDTETADAPEPVCMTIESCCPMLARPTAEVGDESGRDATRAGRRGRALRDAGGVIARTDCRARATGTSVCFWR